MKFAAMLAVVLMAVLSIGSSMAVPVGKAVEYAGGPSGKVIMEGKQHAGLKCPECHPKIWQMKKGAGMKMAEMNAGKLCGTCHNGAKGQSFKTSDPANCAKCHKK